MGLIIGHDSVRATEEEVRMVPVPERTSSWVPTSHAEVLDGVRSDIMSMGLRVTTQDFALWNGGARFFSVMEISTGQNHDMYSLAVGVRNSLDKSIPVGIALGGKVHCCTNLMWASEIILKTRHTLNVRSRLPILISKAMGLLTEHRRNQSLRVSSYINTELDDLHVSQAIVKAVRQKIICPSMVGKLLREWDQPSFDEFKPRTVWSLHNCFTHILKSINPIDLPARTVALNSLCDGYSQIAFQSFNN